MRPEQWLLMVKKNVFSSSGQRFVTKNSYYTYDSKERAVAVKKALEKEPGVIEIILFKEELDV